MGEHQKEDIEGTQVFDTAEFLRNEAETADRKKPIENLHRYYLCASYLEDQGQLWGAVLALQEALAILPYTPISIAEQEDLSSKFTSRIENLTARLHETKAPWPGEAADLADSESLPIQPKPLRVLAAKLGLTALTS